MSECIAEKIRPKNWSEFIGNPLAVSKVQAWCKQHNRRGILLISGPSGIGKTSMAALSLMGDRTPYIIDPSSTETGAKHVLELAKQATSRRPLDGTPPIGLLIDDIDGGGVKPSDIISVASQIPTCPIVITCRDAHTSDSMRKLAQASRCHVTLGPVGRNDTQTLLRRVCQTMNAKLNHVQALHIHEKSCGDLRQAVLLGEMEARGGLGAKVVTEESDSRLAASQEANMLMACAILGLPSGHPKGHTIEASACIQSDPVRGLAMAHDLGLETLIVHDRRGTAQALDAWASVCDDISVGDYMERRGGSAEAYELIGNAMPSRSNGLWGERPARLNPRSVNKPPAMFTSMKNLSTNKKCNEALHRVLPVDAWSYPLASLLKSDPTMLPQMVKDYEMTESQVDAIGKSMKLSKETITEAKKNVKEEVRKPPGTKKGTKRKKR